MLDARFRLVCAPGALRDAPADWTRAMLEEGELALMPGSGGLDEIDEVARALGLASVAVVRREPAPDDQAQVVAAHAGELALVWVAPSFSQRSRDWARERGPMTLLVECDGPLAAAERARITRFVAALGRQSE